MKRFVSTLLASVLAAGLIAGCGGTQSAAPDSGNVTLVIGATPVPHAEILRFTAPLAEKEGLTIKVVEFTDYVKPNLALSDKELDANYFQHIPYLTTFSTDRKLNLVSAGPVHLEPLGFYSAKVAHLAEIKDGAVITIPDDPSNTGRALALLAQQGLIALKEGVGVKATPKDIVANPKGLDIKLLNAEQLPRTLQDAAAAVINTNYYLEAEKNLKLNAKVLARESAEENPFANVVAVRAGDEARPEIKKLMELLNSPEVKRFIEEKYQGAVAPAF